MGEELFIYLMVFPVRRRIHWGMGRLDFWALASLTLVRKDLWLCGGMSAVFFVLCSGPISRVAGCDVMRCAGCEG